MFCCTISFWLFMNINYIIENVHITDRSGPCLILWFSNPVQIAFIFSTKIWIRLNGVAFHPIFTSKLMWWKKSVCWGNNLFFVVNLFPGCENGVKVLAHIDLYLRGRKPKVVWDWPKHGERRTLIAQQLSNWYKQADVCSIHIYYYKQCVMSRLLLCMLVISQ